MDEAINAIALWTPARLDALVHGMITIYYWLLANEWVFVVVCVLVFFDILIRCPLRR